jgi:hypothetical protein
MKAPGSAGGPPGQILFAMISLGKAGGLYTPYPWNECRYATICQHAKHARRQRRLLLDAVRRRLGGV